MTIKSILLFLILTILFFSLNAKAAGTVFNTENDNARHNTKTSILVDTYLFDIDDFNLMKGSYEMIFYMGFTCQPSCNHLHFEFINGKVESADLFKTSPNFYYYRVTARLSQDMDFHQYPFEKHNLHIILEDKFLNKDKLEFIADKLHSGLNKEINLLGWSEEPTWTAKVVDYHYPNYNETNSRYIFTMEIVRPILAGILKNIVPGVFIMLIGFLTIFLDAEKAVNGLAIASGALISMILLHLATISNIPENDYMTYLDGFMIVNYFGLLLLLAELIALINSSSFTERHHKFLRIARWITPGVWLTLQIINCLIFFWPGRH